MKSFARALLLAVAAIGLSSPAFALSFSADVPLQFTFANSYLNANKDAKPKDSTVADVNGVILGASAGWLGVGYEFYDVKSPGFTVSSPGNPSVTFDTRVRFQLYDVFLDLPTPFINTVLGYGQGQVNVQFSNLQGPSGMGPFPLPRVKAADVSQYFVRLGIPIGHVFDLHLGYHVLAAQDADLTVPGSSTPDKFKSSGQTLTAGVRLGF